MEYHLIDMSTYPRRAHFAYFNAMPELRQRIQESSIIEFDACDTSHTVLLANHALVDGVHIGAFCDRLQEELNRFMEGRP